MSRSRSAESKPTGAKLTNAAPVFAALGDATRLRVVARLCVDGPQSITRLSDGAKVTRQAITKHLHALAGVGLVRGHRHGREVIWELQPEPLETAHRYLNQISTEWDVHRPAQSIR